MNEIFDVRTDVFHGHTCVISEDRDKLGKISLSNTESCH